MLIPNCIMNDAKHQNGFDSITVHILIVWYHRAIKFHTMLSFGEAEQHIQEIFCESITVSIKKPWRKIKITPNLKWEGCCYWKYCPSDIRKDV